MIKLYRARSLLYRRQILQENMRLKALAGIYTMHSFAQAKNSLTFKICKNLEKLASFFENFRNCLIKFYQFFRKKCDFREVQRSALCRSRRELSNAYLLAKFRFDTAENELAKNLQNLLVFPT